MSRGRYPEAIEHFKKALKIEPQYLDARFLLGICYQQTKQYDEALGAFSKIMETNKNFEPAYIYLASVYMDKGELKKAEEVLGQVLLRNPCSAQAIYAQGVIAYRRGRLDESIKLWEKSSALDKTLAAAFGNTAVAQYNLGRSGEALLSIQTALRLQPNRVEYSFDLGWILRRLGDLKGAEKAFGEVLKFGKDSPESLMVEALQAIEEKDLTLAARKAGEAGQKDPSNQRADWLMGLCFEKEEKWDEALKCYQEALNKDNKDIDAQEAFQRAMTEVQKRPKNPSIEDPREVSPDKDSGDRQPDEEKTR